MTREERIDWLCRFASPLMTAEQKSKFIEALTETIEDLRKETRENAKKTITVFKTTIMKEEIKKIIIKSLDTALNEDIAEAYNYVVGCNDCPYYHECRNEHDCTEYIYDKLEV